MDNTPQEVSEESPLDALNALAEAAKAQRLAPAEEDRAVALLQPLLTGGKAGITSVLETLVALPWIVSVNAINAAWPQWTIVMRRHLLSGLAKIKTDQALRLRLSLARSIFKIDPPAALKIAAATLPDLKDPETNTLTPKHRQIFFNVLIGKGKPWLLQLPLADFKPAEADTLVHCAIETFPFCPPLSQFSILRWTHVGGRFKKIDEADLATIVKSIGRWNGKLQRQLSTEIDELPEAITSVFKPVPAVRPETPPAQQDKPEKQGKQGDQERAERQERNRRPSRNEPDSKAPAKEEPEAESAPRGEEESPAHEAPSSAEAATPSSVEPSAEATTPPEGSLDAILSNARNRRKERERDNKDRRAEQERDRRNARGSERRTGAATGDTLSGEETDETSYEESPEHEVAAEGATAESEADSTERGRDSRSRDRRAEKDDRRPERKEDRERSERAERTDRSAERIDKGRSIKAPFDYKDSLRGLDGYIAALRTELEQTKTLLRRKEDDGKRGERRRGDERPSPDSEALQKHNAQLEQTVAHLRQQLDDLTSHHEAVAESRELHSTEPLPEGSVEQLKKLLVIKLQDDYETYTAMRLEPLDRVFRLDYRDLLGKVFDVLLEQGVPLKGVTSKEG